MDLSDLRITDNLPEVILALNVDGDIIFANTAFESKVAPFERVQGKLINMYVLIIIYTRYAVTRY